MQEYSSGSSFIYIPRLTAGLHSVALASETAFATFNLRVEIFKKGTKPSPKSIAVRTGALMRTRAASPAWLRCQMQNCEVLALQMRWRLLLALQRRLA